MKGGKYGGYGFLKVQGNCGSRSIFLGKRGNLVVRGGRTRKRWEVEESSGTEFTPYFQI